MIRTAALFRLEEVAMIACGITKRNNSLHYGEGGEERGLVRLFVWAAGEIWTTISISTLIIITHKGKSKH
jgi:hypothetical protein